MRIVDSHCHLDFDDFSNDLDEVIGRARAAGVSVMQTICTKLSRFEKIHQLAMRYQDIYCSVGVHPNEVIVDGVPAVARLLECANLPKVIGLGETGLDYYRGIADRDLQIESFVNHIKVAQQTSLPLIIHMRDAEEDMLELLTKHMQEQKFAGLIHCFTASKEFAERVLALDMYISISGIVTFNNAKALQATVRELPLDRLLVETDAPYLAPVPHRGRRNEPSYTRNTVEFLARLFERSVEEISETTTANFYRLFAKAK